MHIVESFSGLSIIIVLSLILTLVEYHNYPSSAATAYPNLEVGSPQMINQDYQL